MTSTFPDHESDSTEEIKQQVMDGMKEAIKKETSSKDESAVGKTKTQKLLYFAIRDFDLPITYSWYLLGAVTNSEEKIGDVQYIDSPTSTVSPHSESGEKNEETNEDTNELNNEIGSYCEYFRQETFMDGYELSDILDTEYEKFLCDFYEQECDEKYKDLYIYSTKLRGKIEHIIREAEKRVDRPNSDGGVASGVIISSEEEEEFRKLVSDVQMELASIESLDECRREFRKGMREIEAIVAKVTNEESVFEKQFKLLKSIRDFYLRYVWKYPVLKVSMKTATGDNKEKLRQKRENTFNNFSEILLEETKEVRKDRREYRMHPSPDEYVSNENDEVVAGMHEMFMKIDRGEI